MKKIITPYEISVYFQSNIRLIVALILIGFLSGSIIFFASPKKYEGTVNIALAMTNNRYSPNAEDVVKLITNPEDISDEMLAACNYDPSNQNRKALARSIGASRYDRENSIAKVWVVIEGSSRALECTRYLATFILEKSNFLNETYQRQLASSKESIKSGRLSSIATPVNVSDSYIYPRPFLIMLSSILLTLILGLYFSFLLNHLRKIIRVKK
jgi:capsular polysaccharide biosynthesis protein